MRKELFLTCSCHWLEHQLMVAFDDEDGWNEEAYLAYHLVSTGGFWKRLFKAIKYAFNPKCRFGAWDEFILKREDTKRLSDFLAEIYKVQDKAYKKELAEIEARKMERQVQKT